MTGTAVVLALTIGLVAGYVTGAHLGANDILHRDHVQASAGFFIDGWDKNKVYTVAPKEAP